AFHGMVEGRLAAQGVSPNAPYARLDLPTPAAEDRTWLEGGGSSMRAYHLGGRLSPAAASTRAGATLGLVLGGVAILLDPDHPNPVRVLPEAIVVGAAGGYAGGWVELTLNARLAPVELNRFNAPLSGAIREMILWRGGSGAGGGLVLARALV